MSTLGSRESGSTAQQRHYALMAAYERRCDTDKADALRAGGPPEPERPDRIAGVLAYYVHRADHGDERAARFVRRLPPLSDPRQTSLEG